MNLEFISILRRSRSKVSSPFKVHSVTRDSGVVGLLMHNAGQNLRQREIEQTGEDMPAQETLSEGKFPPKNCKLHNY